MPKKNSIDTAMRVALTIYNNLFAFALLLFFGVAPFVGFRIAASEALGIIQVILPIFTGYIGLISGYYFGTREKTG
jgi:hypothetical protein